MKPDRVEIAIASALLVAIAIGVAAYDRGTEKYVKDALKQKSLFLPQRYYPALQPVKPVEPTEWYAVWGSVFRFGQDASMALLGLTAGVVLLSVARRLRGSAPANRAGILLCVPAVVVMAICTVEESSFSLKFGNWPWMSVTNPFPNAWPPYEMRIGVAVLGAGLCLRWTDRLHATPDWLDRLGLALGAGWMLVLLHRILLCCFIPFGNWGY